MTTVTFRNGTTVSDGSDEATTLRNGGHRTRFVPALVGTVEAAAEAKGWASLLGAVVYDSEYSAKEYAVGTTCPSGSAKSWAVGTGVVAGGLYSAKYYMEQSQLFSNSALNAPGTSATSVSPLTIGTGTKNLTIQTGKAFSVGQFVIIADQTVPANYMVGQILSHNSTTGALSVNVTVIGGTGTGLTNWIVSLTALANAAGAATLGGNNTYSGTNTYGAATTFNATATFSATLDSTGVFNASGDTAKRFRNSGQAAFEIQNGTGAVSNFASVKLITPTKTWEMGTEGGNGRWFLYDGSQDIISATSTATVINKPQRTDAATSANDLVRKAELDNASVQSIVTTSQGALSGFRNKIVNGCARVTQRTTSGTLPGTNTTTSKIRGEVDRWYVSGNSPSNMTISTTSFYGYKAVYLGSSVLAGTTYSNSNWCSGITTEIERQDIKGLLDSGQNMTLSFMFKATSSGVYTVKLRDTVANKECLKTFNYTSANSIQSVVVTFPPADAGTMWGSTVSSELNFIVSIGGVGGGSFTKSSEDILWSTGSASVMVQGSVLWYTSANSISATNIQLEQGSVATPFESRPYQVELAMCQRYYETGYFKHWGSAAATGHSIGTFMPFKVQKRIAPTSIGTSGASGTPVFESIAKDGTAVYFNSTTVGTNAIEFLWTASAE